MKLVEGVGLNDADYPMYRRENGKIIWTCPFYKVWKSLLVRSYSENFQKTWPTYRGCAVSGEWHQFTDFKNWMSVREWLGNHLDKDILIEGNKIYGPSTCVFVKPIVNTFLNDNRASRGEYPIGVSFHKLSGKFQAECSNPFLKKADYLGLYACPDQAHQAWKARKLEHALTLASQQTDDRIAMALVARYC